MPGWGGLLWLSGVAFCQSFQGETHRSVAKRVAARSGMDDAAAAASTQQQAASGSVVPGSYVLTAASADPSVWGTLPPCKSREFSVANPRTDFTLSYDRVRRARSCAPFGGLNPGTSEGLHPLRCPAAAARSSKQRSSRKQAGTSPVGAKRVLALALRLEEPAGRNAHWLKPVPPARNSAGGLSTTPHHLPRGELVVLALVATPASLGRMVVMVAVKMPRP